MGTYASRLLVGLVLVILAIALVILLQGIGQSLGGGYAEWLVP